MTALVNNVVKDGALPPCFVISVIFTLRSMYVPIIIKKITHACTKKDVIRSSLIPKQIVTNRVSEFLSLSL